MTREDLITILRERRESDWLVERQRNSGYIDLRKSDLRNVDLTGWTLGEVALDGSLLQGAVLQKTRLAGSYLVGCNLTKTNLAGAMLERVSLNLATIQKTDLTEAKLAGAQFVASTFNQPILEEADLRGANLAGAKLRGVRLCRAKLDRANLTRADLGEADLTNAELRGAKLLWAQMDRATLDGAILDGAHVYGVAAWAIQGVPRQQEGLVVSRPDAENQITVEDIEVAQQLHTFLDNPKISRAIDALSNKIVLILGRFTENRIAVLREIRCALRKCDAVPVLFDFPKPEHRDIMETVTVLAGLTALVLADFTAPRMVLEEVPRILESYRVPVQPLLLEGCGDEPYWLKELCERGLVLPTYRYRNGEDWSSSLRSLVEKSRRERRPHDGRGIEERGQRTASIASALDQPA